MKFVAREDIDVPIEQVFEMLSDFEAFERSALRRGAEVDRLDDLYKLGPGMAWDVKFTMRGKSRRVKLELDQVKAPSDMGFVANSQGMDGVMQIELVALSRQKTRMNVNAEVLPRSLTARLFVQSLKLARASLNKRLNKRMATVARDFEDRYSRMV
jgi:carbon monoxide dehydrogenase subunit G